MEQISSIDTLRETPKSTAVIVLVKDEAAAASLVAAGFLDGDSVIARTIGQITLPEPDWRDYYDAGPMLVIEQLVVRAASIASDKPVVVRHVTQAAGSVAYAWESASWLTDAYKNVTVVKAATEVPMPSKVAGKRAVGESGVLTADAAPPPEPAAPSAPPSPGVPAVPESTSPPANPEGG